MEGIFKGIFNRKERTSARGLAREKHTVRISSETRDVLCERGDQLNRQMRRT